MILEVFAAFITLVGVGFILIAAIGLVRMGGVFTRLQGASKAAPFGATLTLIGLAVASGSAEVIVRVIVICAFLLMTTPIAAHLIGRAAYLEGARPAPDGLDGHDDLEGKYDLDRGELASAAVPGQSEDRPTGSHDAST